MRLVEGIFCPCKISVACAYGERPTPLAIAVKRLTQGFPKTGYGSLRNQMTRSAESIPDNIAEGCGAATNPEFARFLDSSIKSTSELESQFERTHAYGLMDVRRYDWFTTQVQDVRKMTWSLRKRFSGHPRTLRRRTIGRKTHHGGRAPAPAYEKRRSPCVILARQSGAHLPFLASQFAADDGQR